MNRDIKKSSSPKTTIGARQVDRKYQPTRVSDQRSQGQPVYGQYAALPVRPLLDTPTCNSSKRSVLYRLIETWYSKSPSTEPVEQCRWPAKMLVKSHGTDDNTE